MEKLISSIVPQAAEHAMFAQLLANYNYNSNDFFRNIYNNPNPVPK